MRSGLQHPLVAADVRQERPRPFVVPVAGKRIGRLVGEIGRNLRPPPTPKLRSALGVGVK